MAREFWITLVDGGTVDLEFDPNEKNYIHVIEKSAYDELKAKADKLAEALEICAKSNSYTDPTGIHFEVATEALARYRG